MKTHLVCDGNVVPDLSNWNNCAVCISEVERNCRHGTSPVIKNQIVQPEDGDKVLLDKWFNHAKCNRSEFVSVINAVKQNVANHLLSTI